MEPAVSDWPTASDCCPLPTLAQPTAGDSTAECVSLQPVGLVVGTQVCITLFVSGNLKDTEEINQGYQ
jgi:hypothetical protein